LDVILKFSFQNLTLFPQLHDCTVNFILNVIPLNFCYYMHLHWQGQRQHPRLRMDTSNSVHGLYCKCCHSGRD